MELDAPQADGADGVGAQSTRIRLILAAMELFADHGVEGASLRSINELAECRNSSAVHYHFGNRLKLIGAVLEFIGSRWNMERFQARNLDNVPDLLRVISQTLLDLHNTAPWGPNAIRFMQRLMMERDAEILALWRLHFGKFLEPIAVLLSRLHPERSAETMRLRLILTVVTLINAVAGLDAFHRTALGDVRGSRTDAEMLEELVAYAAGGLLTDDAVAPPPAA